MSRDTGSPNSKRNPHKRNAHASASNYFSSLSKRHCVDKHSRTYIYIYMCVCCAGVPVRYRDASRALTMLRPRALTRTAPQRLCRNSHHISYHQESHECRPATGIIIIITRAAHMCTHTHTTPAYTACTEMKPEHYTHSCQTPALFLCSTHAETI